MPPVVVVEIREALQRLGFTPAAATAITNAQGLDTWEEIKHLTDDQVETLCKVVRRPSNGNNGNVVSMLAEDFLKLLAFYLKLLDWTSEPLDPAAVTKALLRPLSTLKTWMKDHKDPEPPTINNKDWPRNIEALEEYFRGCLSSNGVPLAYVIREEEAPADAPPGGWPTTQDHMIMRCPIRTGGPGTPYTLDFPNDNQRVWELLSAITRDLDYCWTYVKAFQRTRDGRGAYLALKSHYLGDNYVDQMASAAEHKLANTFYNGERRNFSFEKYVRVHVEQHTILNGLKEYGYTGIDDRSKVRYLISGIKTDKFDSVKTQILSTPAMRSDFDKCVNLYTEFIQQLHTHNPKSIGIAALTTGGKPGNPKGGKDSVDWDSVKADMSVPDRYYTAEEYNKLSLAKRKGLKLKREARGHTSKKKGKGGRGGGKELNKNIIIKAYSWRY